MVTNLKLDAPALPVDHTKMTILASATQGRTIVAAASTHPGEESAIIDAHRRLTTDDSLDAAVVADFVVSLVLNGLLPRD